MPLGLQVIGPWLDENIIFQVAKVIEDYANFPTLTQQVGK